MTKLDKAIRILKEHQEWRLGGDGEPTNPQCLTSAINTIIGELQPKPTPIEGLSEALEALERAEIQTDERGNDYIEMEMDDFIKIRTALQRPAVDVEGWQPIETAPNNERINLKGNGVMRSGVTSTWSFTHWQPITPLKESEGS